MNGVNYSATNRQPIALAANYHYAEHVMTTIKSICYHNQHIQFYLLNNDYPQEWFDCLNQFLAPINCEINNIIVDNDVIKQYKTYPHISSESTFFRYFIPTLIHEEKILYLDCDLIVNGSLKAVFEIDLSDYFVAATPDYIDEMRHRNSEFNAGVLFINNALWKANNVTEIALDLTEKFNDKLMNADQTVLSGMFKDKWLKMSRFFNYQVGADYIFAQHNRTDLLEDLGDKSPLIIHFNTAAKPWNNLYTTRFREYYWFYYQLQWHDIIQRHQ